MILLKYFDLHCDTIGECALQNVPLKQNSLNISLERAAGFDAWAQAFACWIPDNLRGGDALSRFDLVYNKFIEQMKQNPDTCSFCRNFNEMQSAVGSGKAACFFTIEGSAAFAGSIENFYACYEKGVRMVTLTWNGSCEAGDGCRVDNAKGLTDFGRKLVREMSRLGVIIDVSHLSDRGFYNVALETEKPFVASHSNSRAVCASKRNLNDEQFCEIVKRQGLAGLNFYPEFINETGKISFNEILKHVEHFLELGGENVLAFGADFDGAVVRPGELTHEDPLPYDLAGIQNIRCVYDYMLRFYEQKTVDNIFFDNAYRYFKKNLTA